MSESVLGPDFHSKIEHFSRQLLRTFLGQLMHITPNSFKHPHTSESLWGELRNHRKAGIHLGAWGLTGSPVVKTVLPTVQSTGSVTGWGTKILLQIVACKEGEKKNGEGLGLCIFSISLN